MLLRKSARGRVCFSLARLSMDQVSPTMDCPHTVVKPGIQLFLKGFEALSQRHIPLFGRH